MGQLGKKLIISLSFSPNNYNITYERQESIMIDGGLVVQGGGTRGAFAAGALDVLSEKGLIFSRKFRSQIIRLLFCIALNVIW